MLCNIEMILVRVKKETEQMDFSYVVSETIKSYNHIVKLWTESNKVKQIPISAPVFPFLLYTQYK